MTTENKDNESKVEQEDKSTNEKLEDAFIDDVVQKVPEEDRHEVRRMMSLTMQMGRVMSSSPEMELMT